MTRSGESQLDDLLDNLLELLADEDEKIVSHVVRELEGHDRERVEEALLGALPTIVEGAIDDTLGALARFERWSGPRGGRALLHRAYGYNRAIVRTKALRLLGVHLLVDDQELLLGYVAKEEDASVLSALFDCLDERFETEAVVEVVLPHLESIESRVRAKAVDVLLRHDAQNLESRLDILLDDPVALVRANAIRVLWKSDPVRMRTLILKEFGSPDIKRQQCALSLLGELVPFEDAPGLLIQRLGDDNRDTRRLAAQGLVRCARDVDVEILLMAYLDEGDSEIRATIARALGRLDEGRRDALEAFRAFVRDEELEPERRANAARGIGEVGGDGAFELLASALDDDDSRVRANAVEGLGLCAGPRTQRVLEPLLDDLSPRVCANAALALWRLGDHAAVERLVGMLSSDDSRSQACAAFALGEIGSEDVVGPLTNAYQTLSSRVVKTDDQQYVCDNLARALEKIRDGGSPS